MVFIRSLVQCTAGLILLVVAAGCATNPPMTATRPAWPTPPAQPISPLQGSSHTVRPGETLWRIARFYGLSAGSLMSANRLSQATRLKPGQQLFIPLPVESQQFVWPVRGSWKVSGSAEVEIAAPAGSLVRASRSGRVAVATRQLSGLGKTVVLDHLDGYLSVYAGLDQILAAPGAALKQGMILGSLGTNALHFQIRYGLKPKNALALLPAE